MFELLFIGLGVGAGYIWGRIKGSSKSNSVSLY